MKVEDSFHKECDQDILSQQKYQVKANPLVDQDDEIEIEEDYDFPNDGHEDVSVIRSGSSAAFEGAQNSTLPDVTSVMTPNLSSTPYKHATDVQMKQQSPSQNIGSEHEMILSPKSRTGIKSKENSVFYNNQQEKRRLQKSPEGKDCASSELSPQLNIGQPLQMASTYVPLNVPQQKSVPAHGDTVPVRMSAGIHNVGN